MKKELLKLLVITTLIGLVSSCDISLVTEDIEDLKDTKDTKDIEDTKDTKDPGGTDDLINLGSNSGRMQQFIRDISSYAHKSNSQFMIIPQNGEELAFVDTRPSKGLLNSFINAIDGFGIEELFYNDRGKALNDRDRVSMLQTIGKRVKIMVADYVTNDADFSDSIAKSLKEGFIAFPRSKNNYDYQYIPAQITNENKDNINTLGQAKNYLYLIGPSSKDFPSKNALIQAIAATNFDVILIDLFANGTAFTKSEIQQLKTKANNGKRLVVSYISIGSAEKYRYYWKTGWGIGNPSWIKKNYDGYPDEFWIEFWNPEWREIIFDYIDRIVTAGFDGAYLDNVEVYSRL